MRRARVSSLLAGLLAPFFDPTAATAAIGAAGPMALDHNPIRAKQQVPDDPLAGLPPEDGGKPSRGKGGAGKGGNQCRLDAKPANGRDIGDLRAALAFVERGPRSWPCPGAAAGNGVGLRVAIDGAGKVTAAEPAGGEPGVALAIAKKLTGKSIAPRPAGSTTGTVLVTFSPGKGR
jgi:hypothetical protein